MTRYYIAGPMSGHEGYNFETFDRYASELRRRNLTIVSPAEIARHMPGKIGSQHYTEYLREDLFHLLECDALILLPGWRTSRGARMEQNIAEILNMHIYWVDTEYRIHPTRLGNQDVTAVPSRAFRGVPSPALGTRP